MSLGEKETKDILDNFYKECLRFWEREVERGQDVVPEEMALRDVRNLTYDPRSPKGRKLDGETVKTWVIKDGQ